MAGTKRAAEDEGTGPTTRSAKAPKTEGAKGRTARGGKKGPRAMAASAFKARALPLHVNLTHTPPVAGEGVTTVASTDPGFIGTTALIPNTFSTGSYGWKGNKRIAIELENESGEKEKVHVMFTINATVMGSKGAKEGDEGAEEHAEDLPEADAKETETEAKLDELVPDTADAAEEAEA